MTEAKTTKNWILGDNSEYEAIFGSASSSVDTIQGYLSAAGATPLAVGGDGYATWCYWNNFYFMIYQNSSNSYYWNYYNWGTGAAGTGRKARFIFFY